MNMVLLPLAATDLSAPSRHAAQRAAMLTPQGTAKLAIASDDAKSKAVIVADHATKSFGDRPIVKDFTLRITRKDRIGVVGSNGAGKTTLLKLILGESEPDSELIERDTKQSVAYFDQMREQLDEEATLADTISPGSDFVEIGNERKHVISYLEDFLFPPQRSRSPVKSLSGGERNRLLLARLFARPANILVLDEPTNDLDIDTLELLESLLQEFQGTLFLVSHDRAFLENTVTQVIAFEGNGILTEFGGGYDDWQRFTQKRAEDQKSAEQVKQKQASAPTSAVNKPAPAKLSFKEQKELEALPAEIEKLEQEQTTISDELAKPETYNKPDVVKTLQTRLDEIEALTEAKLSRWEALESLQNKA